MKNRPILHIFFLLFIVIICAISCKKKAENLKPVIEIILPKNGAVYTADDEIIVRFKVTDDQLIKAIRVGVNDENNIAIATPQSFEINQKEVEKEVIFKLNNPTHQSGKYYITIVAFDEESETKKYIEITILEAARKLIGFIVCSNNTSNTSLLNIYNSLGEYQQSISFDSKVNNYYFFPLSQSVLTVLSSQKAMAYSIPGLSKVWEYANSIVSGINKDENNFYLHKTSHYTTRINSLNYTDINNFYDPAFYYYPQLAETGNNIVCTYQKSLNNNEQNKITCFDLNTSGIVRDLLCAYHIKSMVHLQNNVFALNYSDANNNHHIGMFSYTSNDITPIYSSSSDIYSLIKISDNKLLLHQSSSLSEFSLQNYSLLPLLNNSSIFDFTYNDLNSEIYTVESMAIKKYNLSGNLLQSIPLPYQPSMIRLMYNR
ncbi:MAG: hypothetical protein IT238_11510 [Bacteroidia bacterium]|nr:hypothetical protein [Bacteroidia bacterium]MCZ2249205.1 hypothetical protein [Bacteroidia bacterium]